MRSAKSQAEGKYVLYWMSTAVRDEENPALDVAIHEAATRKLPLLVASFLLKSHTYPTHRRYKFLLEGLQDVQTSLDTKVTMKSHICFKQNMHAPCLHIALKVVLHISSSQRVRRVSLRASTF